MTRRREHPRIIEMATRAPWQVSAGLCAASLVAAFVLLPLMAGQNAIVATLVLLFLAIVFGFVALLRSFAREHESAKTAQVIERSEVFWEERRKHRRNLPAVDVEFEEFVPPVRTEPSVAPKSIGWSIERLQSFDSKRFEEVVAAYFGENNFRCETLAYGPDGGVDARLYFRDQPAPVGVVQCMAWGTRQVGVGPVRELLGVMARENVRRGYFAATGDFSDEAIRFAAANPIKLISGADLLTAIARMDADRGAQLLAGDLRIEDEVGGHVDRARELRQAVRADIPAIEAVRYAVKENPLRRGLISPEDIRREIEETGRGWVIETPGDGVVAFAIGNARSGNIWALFVAPGFEGLGHGSRLHTAMVDWLWSRALDLLWLETGRATRARAFYEKRGWQCVGDAPHDQVRYELRRSDDPSG